jgi:S1-C subfamily serine protease
MKRSSILVLAPVVAVLALGTMNVVRKAEWRDVTDGVTWKAAESGLKAIRVDPESEAFLRAGIRKGDVLTAINKIPVRTKSDVLKGLWQAAATDQSVTYDINKEGMQIYPTFYPQKKPVDPI